MTVPGSGPGSVTAELRSADDWDGFRQLARRLLQAQVAPQQVRWALASGGQDSLFDDTSARWRVEGNGPLSTGGADPGASADPITSSDPAGSADDTRTADDTGSAVSASPLRLPARFVDLARAAALHDDDDRHDFLYGWVWRLAHERGVWADALSEARIRLDRMAQTVRREMHKMTAFVRFQPALDDEGQACHVAWFEPEHHVVAATAPFFVRRFTTLRWAIFTPRACARWDGKALRLSPGVARQTVPPDDGQALWLAYYASTFNPARLKLKMMQKEMPQRYWRNLPEAQLIAPLAAQSAQRQHAMIERPAVERTRKRGVAPPLAASAQALVLQDDALPASLQALSEQLRACTACPLYATATQVVPGRGAAGAQVMLVGEQPGDREDLEGLPFVGPAGQLLQRVLQAMPWAADAYVTNAVKHFKYEFRGKRRLHKTAAQKEVLACSQWLEKEIALVQPAVLVALGATAVFSLLGEAVPVLANEGQWRRRADGRLVLIARHPAALLRTPDGERDAAIVQWTAALMRAAEPPLPASP